MSRFRSKVLAVVGASFPVTVWASAACKPFGVEVRQVPHGVELSKEGRRVVLAAKHAFFAKQVAMSFDAFAYALHAQKKDGDEVVDFSDVPSTFNLCRECLQWGVVIEATDNGVRLRKGDAAMLLSAKHLVYAVDMGSKFDLYFSPLVPEKRGDMEVLDFSRPGILQTYRKSGLQFEMASFPEEEEAIEEYFRWYRPKAGDLVFDMGAHCGVSSYYLSKLVGEAGHVVSFEPDPVNYAILKRNIERHGLTNVTAENTAIAGEAGSLAFNSEGTIGSALVSLLGRESVGSIVTVNAITLADAFRRWGKPAFCKIDIEGAEIEVISKSSELLRTQKTNFALDTNHSKVDGKMTNQEIEEMFTSYGYDVLSEANPLLTTWAKPKK